MSTVLILADFSGDHATKTTAELATAAARIGSVSAVVLAPVRYLLSHSHGIQGDEGLQR